MDSMRLQGATLSYADLANAENVRINPAIDVSDSGVYLLAALG